MHLIEQYIFRRIAIMTLGTLVVVTTIVLSTQLLTQVTLLTQSASALYTFLSIAFFLIPSMAMIVAPFALLVGVIRTMNAMNSDSELAVLEASGRSPVATARPAIYMAVILSLASLLVAHIAEPWANRNLRASIEAASADIVRSAAQAGSFRWIPNGLYIQIAEQLPGGELGQIVIVDMRDPATELIYYAKRGALIEQQGANLFLLIDGQVHRRNRADDAVSIITFASTALDFTEFSTVAAGGAESPQEMSTAALFVPDPNNAAARDTPADIEREIHRRLTEWLYPLVFGLIAIVFSGNARTTRQQQPMMTVAAALLALGLRTGGFIAVSNAGTSTFFAILAYALPIGAIIVFGSRLYADRGVARQGGSGGLMSRISRIPASLAAAFRRPGNGAPT